MSNWWFQIKELQLNFQSHAKLHIDEGAQFVSKKVNDFEFYSIAYINWKTKWYDAESVLEKSKIEIRTKPHRSKSQNKTPCKCQWPLNCCDRGYNSKIIWTLLSHQTTSTRFPFEAISYLKCINKLHDDQDTAVVIDVLAEHFCNAFDEVTETNLIIILWTYDLFDVFQNIKLNRMMNLLRDENLNWRQKCYEVCTDYDLLNESHQNYTMVSAYFIFFFFLYSR